MWHRPWPRLCSQDLACLNPPGPPQPLFSMALFSQASILHQSASPMCWSPAATPSLSLTPACRVPSPSVLSQLSVLMSQRHPVPLDSSSPLTSFSTAGAPQCQAPLSPLVCCLPYLCPSQMPDPPSLIPLVPVLGPQPRIPQSHLPSPRASSLHPSLMLHPISVSWPLCLSLDPGRSLAPRVPSLPG